jgi:AsmA protein
MSRQRKLLFILAFLAIIVLAAAGFLVFRLDPEAIKESLERHLEASSGLQQVRMQGTVELNLLPPGASFVDIVIDNGERELLTAKRVRAGIALLPLLWKEVRLSSLVLVEPVLSLRRDKNGQMLLGTPARATADFVVGSVSVRDGTVRYSDAAGGTELELDGLELELETLRREEGRFSISGELRAGRLGIGRVEVLDLNGSLAGEGNLYRIESLRCGLFGSEAKGSLEVDLGGAHPAWRGELAAGEISLADLSRALADRPLYEGTVEMRVSLFGQGPGRIVDTLNGTVRISGTDLIQHGFDLDGFIRNFRASRDIDLLDIGIYAFAGPVGVLVGKGVDAAGMVWAAGQQERQVIEELVFSWSLEDGAARAEDVAFRTRENRVAFTGTIDLSRGNYKGLTLGLLNAEGCAELTERINGPLASPAVEKVSMLSTLAGSLVGVFRKGWDILDFRECRPFYEGAVGHPAGGKKDNILHLPG